MRCPNCGAENANDAPVCAMCGADLLPEPTDAEVDELMGELPTVAAERAREEERTRLIAERTALLEKELDGGLDDDLDDPTLDDLGLDDLDEDPERTVLAPDPTVVRPHVDDRTLPDPDEEEHFVVRNTRDYDHDAQSANLVEGVENFGTIHDNSRREVRRDPYARSSRRGNVPGEGNSNSKLRPLLALLLVICVLGGGAAVLGYGMEMWGGKTVPSVLGSNQTNAELAIESKGLVARIEAEPADDAIGKVLAQSPDAGTRVPEGSEVTIVIATNRTMPDVVGMSETEARATLEEAGAEHIDTVTKPSGETEGTVIAVDPEAGNPFVSRSTITLTVAGPYRVPDVIGKKEQDAIDVLKEMGLNTEVSYVTSDKTVRTVVETLPAADEIVSEGGTVTIKVSSPYPSSELHLAEYFSHSSQDIDTYLQKEGFSFEQGTIDTLGNAVARYTSSDKGNVTFSSQPYNRSISLPKEGSTNVLSTGAPIAGVRLDAPSSLVPSTVDRSAVEAIAGNCGLEGLKEACDEKSIKVPAGTAQTGATFCCGAGEQGDLVWTVLVVKDGGSTRVSVTCAKKGLYSSSELAPFSGSLCEYVAYQEVYVPVESQAQEKKDDKDKKGDSGKKDDGQAARDEASLEEMNQRNSEANAQAQEGLEEAANDGE